MLKGDKRLLLRLAAQGALLCAAAGLLFYKSIYGVLVFLPYVFVYIRAGRREYEKNQAWEMNGQFCDALKSLSAALEAGYSVENSIGAAVEDLRMTYTEEDAIIRELLYMRQQLKNSISAEQAFLDFAARSGLEDIRGFADIFATAKRTGGDIIRVINQTSRVIQERHEVNREIRTLIASKRYEARIMKFMPFGILLYLNLFCGELCAALYEGFFGRAFMSVILAAYVSACRLIDRLASVEM